MTTPFRLSKAFVETYADREPPFGFSGLGKLVYTRTYSRVKPDGSKEQWHETVERVVNGTYTMQKRHIESQSLGWDDKMAIASAEEMYDRIWNLLMCPPGRGLWAMGSSITEERNAFAALNNCAFISTENIDKEGSKVFCFLMSSSMLGVGVGFDVRGAGKLIIQRPDANCPQTFVIPDSREGWVEALRRLLDSYFIPESCVQQFDYSLIRPAGSPIKTFGGTASGSAPLKKMFEDIIVVLDREVGQTISITAITDIFNLIGCCVVAGNVRRSAELSLGPHDSEEFLKLKDYAVNPQRAAYGWASNNSILGEIGMDYEAVAKQIAVNGEPGIVFMDNMRLYSRMNGVIDNKDFRAKGTNPCAEMVLNSWELCCLTEVFIARHKSMDDFLRTLKFAYLYAKTVTLGKTEWPETNRVLLRNRRIGTSISGIAQFIAQRGLEELRQWTEEGYGVIARYDDIYSDWLCCPRSIKTTTIKPSGTVSLLAGATPGMHYPESRFYIRRVRLGDDSELIPALRSAGYHIEPDVFSQKTSVVSFPIDVGEGVRTLKDVSMHEQLALAAFLQEHWSDNAVSVTITFDPETEGKHIASALNYAQYHAKSLSFLPRLKQGAYPQMPYTEITEEEYRTAIAQIKSVTLTDSRDAEIERFCDSQSCILAR